MHTLQDTTAKGKPASGISRSGLCWNETKTYEPSGRPPAGLAFMRIAPAFSNFCVRFPR